MLVRRLNRPTGSKSHPLCGPKCNKPSQIVSANEIGYEVPRLSKEGFRLDVSAYGPVLCQASAFLPTTREPIRLERYINFEKEL